MYLKKIILMILILFMMLVGTTSIIANDSNNIAEIVGIEIFSGSVEVVPEILPVGGVILRYDENLNISIEKVQDPPIRRNATSTEEILPPITNPDILFYYEQRFEQMIESTKDWPINYVESIIPDPTPGLAVLYGDDGQIIRFWFEDHTGRVIIDHRGMVVEEHVGRQLDILPFSSVLPLGTTSPIGVHTWGNFPNTLRVERTNAGTAVTGTGRFTVFRPGVGGSGTVGSSGKVLERGDVATRMSMDNPRHNTALIARATDTNVQHIVRKNDIGSLPNAVLDVFFWEWNDRFFGYM